MHFLVLNVKCFLILIPVLGSIIHLPSPSLPLTPVHASTISCQSTCTSFLTVSSVLVSSDLFEMQIPSIHCLWYFKNFFYGTWRPYLLGWLCVAMVCPPSLLQLHFVPCSLLLSSSRAPFRSSDMSSSFLPQGLRPVPSAHITVQTINSLDDSLSPWLDYELHKGKDCVVSVFCPQSLKQCPPHKVDSRTFNSQLCWPL